MGVGDISEVCGDGWSSGHTTCGVDNWWSGRECEERSLMFMVKTLYLSVSPL
jgi:hypothetical protein